MQKKIRKYKALIKAFIFRLRDIRFAGQFVFLFVVLLISWSGVKAINLNNKIQKEIVATKQENEIQTLENKDLKLQNLYYSSNQYLDIQARSYYGLGVSGEKEIIVPSNVALSYAPKIKLPMNSKLPSKLQELSYERNIQSWFRKILNLPNNAN